MQKITLSCPNDGRKLRISLTALLKKGLITDAWVQNSIKHYCLSDEKKIQKEERKLIWIWIEEEKKDQFLRLFAQISGWNIDNGELQLMPEDFLIKRKPSVDKS